MKCVAHLLLFLSIFFSLGNLTAFSRTGDHAHGIIGAANLIVAIMLIRWLDSRKDGYYS